MESNVILLKLRFIPFKLGILSIVKLFKILWSSFKVSKEGWFSNSIVARLL